MEHFDPDTLIFFGSIVMIVFIVKIASFRRHQMKIHLIEKMLEQGQNITPEVLDRLGVGNDSTPAKTPGNPLGHGVYLILIGIGLATFFGVMSMNLGTPYFLAATGVFPLVIGLARVITVLYENRQAK